MSKIQTLKDKGDVSFKVGVVFSEFGLMNKRQDIWSGVRIQQGMLQPVMLASHKGVLVQVLAILMFQSSYLIMFLASSKKWPNYLGFKYP